MSLQIIILAAGKGTRMYSKVPKVMHKIGGKPLLEHVIKTAQNLQPEKIHVVCSDNGNLIREYFNQDEINWVEQSKRLGTGHAVMQVLPHVEYVSQILILYGDVPLVTVETLKQLIKNTPQEGLSFLSAEFSDPTGFGRVIKDNLGNITAIIEHKDATLVQKKIKEVNTGIIVTTSKILRDYLPRLHKNNIQEEYYLTDIIAMLYSNNIPVHCLLTANPEEVVGINDKKQLAKLERQYQRNFASNLMLQGVTLMDPDRFDVRGNLTIGDDVVIDANVIIEGEVTIGSDTTIGSNVFLKNVRVGKNVTIKASCVIEDAVISDNCVVGPFARIRPNTFLDQGVHIGNFIEIKNTKIGKNSKAHHVSYLGDSIIGGNVNIGAGTITCNYDGVDKHQTIIEDNVFVGSNTSLVAPVKLGENAIIGAGSVITEDTPCGKLTVARAKQVTVENWQRRKRK